MKTIHPSKSLIAAVLITTTLAFLATTPLNAAGRKKNPTSKLYVADVDGTSEIDTGEKIVELNKRSVYSAQGTVIETKADSTNAMVFFNGTGIHFDSDTRLEIEKFVQEPFTPYRSDMEVEPSISTTPTFLPRGTVGLGIIKLTENLSLLCSGGRSKSPTEFLENPVFGNLLEKLQKEYELIVVDSPPLGAVTDSLLIAERTDEVIYVCRFNRAYRKHIRLYIKALHNAKNEILGVLLNGLTPRRIEYYSNYRYYRSYKKYYGAQS